MREYGLRSNLIKNVVGTETKGVSQREGSVVATIRYLIDGKVYSLDQKYEEEDLISPTIPINDAHLVLGLEPLETLRNIKYISEKTVVILNTHQVYPRNVIIKSVESKSYPSIAEIIELMDQFARRVVSMDFHEFSNARLKNSVYANSMILGAGAREFSGIFAKELLIEIINHFLKGSHENIEAFNIGYDLINI